MMLFIDSLQTLQSLSSISMNLWSWTRPEIRMHHENAIVETIEISVEFENARYIVSICIWPNATSIVNQSGVGVWNDVVHASVADSREGRDRQGSNRLIIIHIQSNAHPSPRNYYDAISRVSLGPPLPFLFVFAFPFPFPFSQLMLS